MNFQKDAGIRILKIYVVYKKVTVMVLILSSVIYFFYLNIRVHTVFYAFLSTNKHYSRSSRKYWIVPANHPFIFCVWQKYLYFTSIFNTKKIINTKLYQHTRAEICDILIYQPVHYKNVIIY